MILHPYFIFNGEAREAITFYTESPGNYPRGNQYLWRQSHAAPTPPKKTGSFTQNFFLKALPWSCSPIVQIHRLGQTPIFTLA